MDDAAIILQDVNVKIPKSKLTIVVGEVGSGKTALVSALLNEMHIKSVSAFFVTDPLVGRLKVQSL